jgi:hypothetical protein
MIVAASTKQGILATYDNFSPTEDIAAPAGDWSNTIMALGLDLAGLNVEAQSGMGTSFAVQHVEEVAALALSTYQCSNHSN